MNRKLVAFLGASLVSLLGVLAWATWERGALPGMRPTMHQTAFAELSLEARGVRVQGTAHYPIRIQLRSGGEPVFAWPLFAPGDTTGREIRVLVLDPVAPDALLGFEDRTLEGLIRPPGLRVPDQVRETLEGQGYRFADGWILLEVM